MGSSHPHCEDLPPGGCLRHLQLGQRQRQHQQRARQGRHGHDPGGLHRSGFADRAPSGKGDKYLTLSAARGALRRATPPSPVPKRQEDQDDQDPRERPARQEGQEARLGRHRPAHGHRRADATARSRCSRRRRARSPRSSRSAPATRRAPPDLTTSKQPDGPVPHPRGRAVRRGPVAAAGPAYPWRHGTRPRARRRPGRGPRPAADGAGHHRGDGGRAGRLPGHRVAGAARRRRSHGHRRRRGGARARGVVRRDAAAAARARRSACTAPRSSPRW